MSYTADQLIKMTNNYEQLTAKSLVVEAKKKGKFPFWLMKNKKKDDKKTDSNKAKDSGSKKLDPKAEVRNRGLVCVPAEKAADKKDHFPINDEAHGRNALAQVAKYTSAPPWYNGSLKSLQDLVSRKVHSKYPSIGKSEKKSKKSSVDYLLAKYGQDSHGFYQLVRNYENGTQIIDDLSEAMKMNAYKTYEEAGGEDEPENAKVRELMLKEAELLSKIHPEMEALDQELYSLASYPANQINKYASVNQVVSLLNNYNSTAEFLRDVAKAQFELSGLDQENPEHQQDEAYESSKVLHDIIMECANKIQPIEEATW